MSGKLDKKSEERLNLKVENIEGEISKLDEKINETKARFDKQDEYLNERTQEIELTKEKINELIDIEAESKTQITQHIEMLSWLIESVDESIENLKASMIDNVDKSIKENTRDFQGLINDFEEVLEPLGLSKTVKNEEELEMLIVGIVSTLELLSENIDESIDTISQRVQEATKKAVEDSGKEFDEFVEDIHQVFETFNTVLQKLKLTNSIKKYVDLEKIYQECNRILDTQQKISSKKAELSAEKSYYQLRRRLIKDFKLKESKKVLEDKQKIIQSRIEALDLNLQTLQLEKEEVEDKLSIIDLEKQNLRSFFEALSDEIVESQKTATETYNVMYSTLENIHSTIPFIKNELKNSSNAAIFDIIAGFRKGIKTFGKIIDFIKKVQKLEDVNKKNQYIVKIYRKAIKHLNGLKKLLKKLSSNVKKSNNEAIYESFNEFNDFIELFKKKFYIIEGTVSAITLGTSEQLIKDLQEYFDDQLEYREKNITIEKNKLQDEHFRLLLDRYLQEINRKLKGYEEKGDRTKRKVIKFRKSITNLNANQITQHRWVVENASVVPVKNIGIFEISSKDLEFDFEDGAEPVNVFDENSKRLVEWNIEKITKRKKKEIAFQTKGFSEIQKTVKDYKKHITPISRFRYRNIAKPLKLDIIERDGEGAILLQNTSENDSVWNIHLKFKPTENVEELPNAKIIALKPQQTFVKKYTYTKPKALEPVIFTGKTQCNMGVVLNRQKALDKYEYDLFFENTSEFLIHLTHCELFDPTDIVHPLIKVKKHNLDVLRPKLDIRKSFFIETPLDPPKFVLDCAYTIHLVFEHIESSIELSELNETKELEYIQGKEKVSQVSIKTVEKEEKKLMDDTSQFLELVTSNPKISKLDKELDKLEENFHDLKLKLKLMRGEIKGKRKKRKALVDKLLEEHEIEVKTKKEIEQNIKKQRYEIEEIKEEKEELEQAKHKLDEIKSRIQKRKKEQRKKVRKSPKKAPKKKAVKKSKTQPRDFEEGLIRVKKFSEADTVAVFVKKNLPKLVRAIESKNKRLKRKTSAFKKLHNYRTKFRQNELLYIPANVAEQLQIILKNEIPSMKKDVLLRYFKGFPENQQKTTTDSKKTSTQKTQKVSKTKKDEKSKEKLKEKPKERQSNREMKKVEDLENADFVGVLCKNCAKQLQKAVNEKNSRLKRKTSDFKALVASKNKIVDDKQFFLDKGAYDQLDILTRQEAEDISDRIITTFYKKSKKINKDKIDDFLNI